MPPETPLDLFEEIRERATVLLKTAFMESEKPWPGEDSDVFKALLLPTLGIGIAACMEYLAAHPEHIALAGQPICTVCREPVQTLQVGVDPSPTDSTEIVKVAWPCGHVQGP